MIVIVPVAIVVIVALLVVAGMARSARNRADHIEHARESDTEMLRYHVPEGHDPAPIIAALQRDGFEVLPDARRMDRNDILIPCPEGKDRHREQVRAVIGGVDAINLDGDPDPVDRTVRFADE